MKRFLQSIIISGILFLLLACSESETEIREPLLAKIGDRNITVSEFIQRAEYAIRPAWCSGESNVHKMTVLNSLIAEKLYAIQAEARKDILRNSEIQNYLRGRKEQEMRQLYFQKIALEKARPDSNEIKRAMLLAERTYEARFIAINNDSLADQIGHDLQTGLVTFDEILAELRNAGMEFPTKSIKFDTPLDDIVFQNLFQKPLKKGQVIGPLRLQNGQNVLIRVKSWTRSPLLSPAKDEQLKKDVSEKLRGIKSRQIYAGHIKALMKGKRIEFNPKIFRLLVNEIGPLYFKSAAERKQHFTKQFWNLEDSTAIAVDALADKVDAIANEPLFTIDNKAWKVRDFEIALQSHPLVFRKQKFSKGEFAAQFQMAIVDMMRDHYITREAYKMGLDRDSRVKARTQMWTDNLLALAEREQHLKDKQIKGLSQFDIVEKYLEKQSRSLRRKYSPQIFIDMKAFKKIKLTKIDMLALQENVPFPVYVPQFPQLTTHHSLDYGHKMIEDKP